MTRTGRNNTVRFLSSLFFIAFLIVVAALVIQLRIVPPSGDLVPDPDQWRAIGGAVMTAVIAFIAAIVYMRLFRRSPSVPIFFVVLFFVFTMLDVTKLGQVMVPETAWRVYSPVLARVSIFGHISSVLALFAAGVYASVARMQRHGTVLLFGMMIAMGLSWAVPIDVLYLPRNLVYTAGLQPSLDSMIQVVVVLAVLNFVQAAVVGRDRRQMMSAGAVALIALGREILFYRTEPVWLVLGPVLFAGGAILFAVENYRDYLVS